MSEDKVEGFFMSIYLFFPMSLGKTANQSMEQEKKNTVNEKRECSENKEKVWQFCQMSEFSYHSFRALSSTDLGIKE
jgi:hypothetical protein